MPYFLEGKAQELFSAFNLGWLVKQSEKSPEKIDEDIEKDIPRSDLFATSENIKTFEKTWKDQSNEARQYYSQGDMYGANLRLILGEHPFFQEKKETIEEYHPQLVKINFAYFDDDNELKSFALVYRKDKPHEWLMALATDVTKAPNERKLFFLKSSEFSPKHPASKKVNVKSNPLLKHVHSDLIKGFISRLIDKKNCINLNSERIQFFIATSSSNRAIRGEYNQYIEDSELTLDIIFKPSRALDILLNLPSNGRVYHPSLFEDCLDQNSAIAQRLIKAKEENRDHHYMLLLIALYESGTHERHQALLKDNDFIARFSSVSYSYEHLLECLKDESKFGLLRFLMQSSLFNSIYSKWEKRRDDNELFHRLQTISELECDNRWIVDVLCLLAFEAPLDKNKIIWLQEIFLSYAEDLERIFKDSSVFVDLLSKLPGEAIEEKINFWTLFFKEILNYEKKLLQYGNPEIIYPTIRFCLEHNYEDFDLLILCQDAQKLRVLGLLLDSKVKPDLYKLCLTTEVYRTTVLLLSDLGYKEAIEGIVESDSSFYTLEKIHQLKNEKAKTICMYFFVNDLLVKNFDIILKRLNEEPELADTVVKLIKANKYLPNELIDIINSPLEAKKECLLHFFDKFDLAAYFEEEDFSTFKNAAFSVEDITALKQSFAYLSNVVNIKDKNIYSRLLKIEEGRELRLLIPLMKGVPCLEDSGNTEKLLSVLLTYLTGEKTYQNLYEEINKFQNTDLQNVAREFLYRLKIIKILEDLELNNEVVKLAAQNTPKATLLREVITRVEDEWEQLKERSKDDPHKTQELEKVEDGYRKDVYQAVYNKTIDKKANLEEEIKSAEEKVQVAVNIDRHPDLRKTMKVIANILTVVFTAFIANALHKQETGSYWFFSRPQSAEDIHALGKDIQKMAAPGA
ncbi:hypothetical protein [Legionella israelensis]|uniref:Uncharacterized protein n=1 Tax=Legionella israelensis TaxID=454 RepID=A0A0W0V1M8_9GAMM|nr:hypothetical protein [Legionella israelensis]KTD14023.1 hypothetical protein Lisr_2799 [Legionella israelensis]QBS09679.1 hypothetical protein E4T55_07285 [Legionella israelensis]SCY04067.1 hypothetical protein SAMN02746069_01077 [Legionella israelensis DSM 19235]STX60614.1 Uncharacterised protein [Legionella israelensis]